MNPQRLPSIPVNNPDMPESQKTASVRKRISPVCILGAGGFIGSHLVERLAAGCGRRAIAVDISCEKIKHLLPHPNVTFVNLDISDTDALAPHIERCGTVILLAALCNPSLYTTVPLAVIEANFTRPFNVLRLCAKLRKRFIYFSTSEVYGRTIAGFTAGDSRLRDDPACYVLSEDRSPMILGPISAQRWSYAAAKQLMERAVYAYGSEHGLEYTIVRPFNFIGPRMDYIPGVDGEGVPRVLACFMEALLSGRPLKLVDGGRNRRCFTYIDDAIDAIVRILERPQQANGRVFNIGNPGNEVTIRELAKKMAALYRELRPACAAAEIQMENVTAREFYGPGYEDSDRRMPDIAKAQKLLGWRPKIDLDAALRRTMASYIEAYGADCACREAC